MPGTQRIVRLLKNELYPTYQLYALMAKNAPPEQGLLRGVRTVLDWLLLRLGENAPADLRELASQEVPLFSYHESCGFGIDVVSIPEQGSWALQITEPDLGSDPGDPNQARQPVPGRVLETNIGFQVAGSKLECGFMTVVSDPEFAREDADVYRLSPVRRLAEDPEFGLVQLTELSGTLFSIGSQDALKAMGEVWHHPDNQLPCVVFTAPAAESPVPDRKALEGLLAAPRPGSLPGMPLPPPAALQRETKDRPAYDGEAFARACFSLCRSYRLKEGMLDRFRSLAGTQVRPGEIAVLYPDVDGGSVRVLPYTPLKTRQEETLAALEREIFAYPRRKERSYGGVAFLSAAHRKLRDQAEQQELLTEEAQREWEQRLTLREAELQAELQTAEEKIETLEKQVSRLKQYQAQLERDKEDLRKETESIREEGLAGLRKKDEVIEFLRRKLSQPRTHGEIAAWAGQHFSSRLLLHQKAVDLLADRSAQTVPIGLICDALDFLATDYWDHRYLRISREEMNSRCSEKYGRPFEIKPTGEQTVAFTPVQYKIKYRIGAKGKPVETPLDYHLCVGSDVENLLRIYFLHDDEKKLIVIGSLPRHLRAVTIQ